MFLDKSFTTLTRMEEVASENRFKCHICLKTLKTKQKLDNHERTHTGEKTFRCDICDKSFTTKQNLDIIELILERNHFSVTFVKYHLHRKVILINTKEFMLVKNHLNVIFVDLNFRDHIL